MPATKSPTGLAPIGSFNKTDLYNAFERFRREVADLINDHDACDGCRGGKNEALEGLGLPVPSHKRRVTIEIDFDPDEFYDGEPDGDDIANTIRWNVAGINDADLISVEDAN